MVEISVLSFHTMDTPKWRHRLDYLPVLVSSILACALYMNTLDAEFVYDDSRAIITNQDLRPETPWSHLLVNDFWGTPLVHSGSHKSYRPLTVATFRLNHYFNQLNPRGYHLVNVLVHGLVTGLTVCLARRLSNGDPVTVWTSGILFGVHPIHTEAVAGIVGRGDLLTTLCFLLCILSYLGLMDGDTQVHSPMQILFNIVSFLFWATGSVLAKEHGLTVLGVCLFFDLVLTSCKNPVLTMSTGGQSRNHRLNTSRQSSPVNKQQQNCSTHSLAHFRRLLTSDGLEWVARRARSIKHRATRWTCIRWSLVIATGLSLTFLRFWLMGFSTPSFSPSDNPAAHAESLLTRLLTFIYLVSFNVLLLLRPSTLSFDWSMDSIPLVEGVSDPRNLISCSLFLILMALGVWIIHRVTESTVGHVGSPSPSPNLASPSGKGVCHSDRVSKPGRPVLDVNGNACSPDDPLWNGRISPNTAKSLHCAVHNCISNSPSSYKLKFRGRNLNYLKPLDLTTDSEHHPADDARSFLEYRTALMGLLIGVLSFLPATNLFFYVGFVVAERVLYLPSLGYCLLVATGLSRLSRWFQSRNRSVLPVLVFSLATLAALSAKTVLRNRDWKNEENLYLSGIAVNPAKAYSNLGNVYAQKRQLDKAVMAYKAALKYRPNMADTHYNYGILLQEKADWKSAVVAYENAIKCRPRMALAHLNLGIVLTSLQRHKEAEQRYLICSELSVEGLKDPKSHESAKLSCLYNLGRLLADQNHHQKAIEAYRLAIQRLHPYYQAHSLHNALGDALSKTGQFDQAEEAFKKSLIAKPDHVPAHLTYGHLLAKTNRPTEALEYFERASTLAPLDTSVWQHLAQFYSNSGHHLKAIEAYKEAWRLSPDDFDATFGLANAYRNLGDTGSAEEFYRKATLLRPQSSNARMNYGAILHMNKKWKQAEEEYLLALEINPKDDMTKENLKKLRRAMSKR